MLQEEAQKLVHGVYRIHWKFGSSSVAAIGSTYDGTRWLVSSNWTAPNGDLPLVATTTKWWEVERVELITIQ